MVLDLPARDRLLWQPQDTDAGSRQHPYLKKGSEARKKQELRNALWNPQLCRRQSSWAPGPDPRAPVSLPLEKGPVLMSWGHHSKVPQTAGLRTAEMDSFTVWRPGI